jgi:hypothetical protein
MRIAFALLLSVTSTSLLAQTKEIAFKSHSGDMKYFNITINNELFDNEDGGYGLPAPTKIKTIKLDTVFYVSDTVSVIVIREFQRNEFQANNAEKLVRTGKDTLYHDALLGRKHSLDSIKTELIKLGYYSNPIPSVVFIGYDNKKTKEKAKGKAKGKDRSVDKKDNQESENNIFPVATGHDGGNAPFDGKLAFMLGTILVLSLLGGWVSWKYYNPEFQ